MSKEKSQQTDSKKTVPVKSSPSNQSSEKTVPVKNSLSNQNMESSKKRSIKTEQVSLGNPDSTLDPTAKAKSVDKGQGSVDEGQESVDEKQESVDKGQGSVDEGQSSGSTNQVTPLSKPKPVDEGQGSFGSAKVPILNWQKETVAEWDLPKGFFQETVKLELINEVVRWQRAKQRQGTHKAKTRADVRGGGKKPFRQKGTGNARQGSIRSPLNRGGGVTFGPKPRNYAYALPKRIRNQAFWQALSHLWENKKIVVLEDMRSPEGKTKELYQRLKVFGYRKALLVDQEWDPLFKRAGGNLKSFPLLPVKGLNVYDMLRSGQLMMSQKALSFLIEKHKNERVSVRESV